MLRTCYVVQEKIPDGKEKEEKEAEAEAEAELPSEMVV